VRCTYWFVFGLWIGFLVGVWCVLRRIETLRRRTQQESKK